MLRSKNSPITYLIIRYLPEYWFNLLLLVICLLSVIIFQIIGPIYLGKFIDSASRGASNYLLIKLATVLLVASIAQQVFSVLKSILSTYIGWSATNRLRSDLLKKFLSLDISFYSDISIGEIIERIDGDTSLFAKLFSLLIATIFSNLILFLVTVVILCKTSLALGLTFLGFALLGLFFMNRAKNLSKSNWKDDRNASTAMSSFLEETVDGVVDIHSLDLNSHRGELFNKFRITQVIAGRKALIRSNMLFGSVRLLFVLGYIFSLGLGASLVQSDMITLGAVLMVARYIEVVLGPIQSLVYQIDEIQKAGASAERVVETLLSESQMESGAENLNSMSAPRIQFENVDFKYGDKLILSDISFSIDSGSTLGLIGRTGSGKTTITRLLSRLYDVSSGNILIDDNLIKNYDLNSLRSSIGIVSQDARLLHGTLRDNLTLYNNNFSDEELQTALEKCGLSTWYARLNDGLDTDISKIGLSMGETQLISLARILLRDPKLVIIDEAVGKLDMATEILLDTVLNKVLQGRTAIIIAHRLSSRTLARMDQIIVLENGKILEIGSKESLMRNSESYLYRNGASEFMQETV